MILYLLPLGHVISHAFDAYSWECRFAFPRMVLEVLGASFLLVDFRFMMLASV